MVLDRDDKLGTPRKFELRGDDRSNDYMSERGSGRSNFAAFLLGGVMIAGGLLSFLYYDSNNLQGMDQTTTGSTVQSGSTIAGQMPSIRILPARPENK